MPNTTPFFLAKDVARILRALDDVEFASTLNNVVTDVTVLRPSLLRSQVMLETSLRAHFTNREFFNLVEVSGRIGDEFILRAVPNSDSSTIVSYVPTQGVLQQFFYRVMDELASDAIEEFLIEVLRRITTRFRQR